jgi:hypothetical protein
LSDFFDPRGFVARATWTEFLDDAPHRKTGCILLDVTETGADTELFVIDKNADAGFSSYCHDLNTSRSRCGDLR